MLHLLATLALGAPSVVMAQSGGETRGDSAHPRAARFADSIELREKTIKRQRGGAGLRLGSWDVGGPAGASGSGISTFPAMEGYWQRGLDRHVVIETSVGLWSRQQHATTPGGASSGSYVVPMLTSIKIYPTTNPGAVLEPFTMAGIGFTLGIDDQNGGSSGGLAGGGSSGGTNLIPGIGLKGGVGVEYHLGPAFGVQMQAGYQFVKFFQDVGADRTYKGMQVLGGLTYRFQF
jgi:hypothetical protein